MANAKHEDAVMKMGVDYFRDTILKSLGIDYDFVEVGPTGILYSYRISDNRQGGRGFTKISCL